MTERLLALQALDTEADQLTLRRRRLPERDELATRSDALAEWERRRASMRSRIDELEAAMEAAEERSAGLREHKQRFEAQLKTIIAPREAEALMHEIATVDEQVEAIESQELDDLTESTDTEESLQAHLREEEALRDALGRADDALAAAVGDIDRQVALLDERRAELRAEVDADLLARYDRVRSKEGVAVARLIGRRCDGCHLDLSAAEVDSAKDAAQDDAAGGITDCPQCGRMLVV